MKHWGVKDMGYNAEFYVDISLGFDQNMTKCQDKMEKSSLNEPS